MNERTRLADDPTVIQRLLDHIDHQTTDRSETTWREPVEHYLSPERFERELGVLRRSWVGFCPSASLREPGSWMAREVAGRPLLVVRGADGRVRAFRNACRHRGTELASGAGCGKAFVCRYHGWTYGLDGRLLHVPHEDGFPGLDKDARSLSPVEASEARGVVFVRQESSGTADDPPEELPPLVPEGHRILVENAIEVPANWKILVEGFLEGYHIRSTHKDTFYPLQYDNRNVVESFGRNSRVAFPYRAIEKLRDVPPEGRSAEGCLTYAHHLFPSSVVATFPKRVFVVALEPLSPGRTRQVTWLLSGHDESDPKASAFVSRGSELVAAGAAEDLAMACAIQRSLSSGANEFFEFGRFEGAIGHFHRSLDAALDGAAA